ncbi:MAG: Txe/YoeB family addiction module toxin [Beijerinckiaceae bacterium]
MRIVFSSEAFEQFVDWQTEDIKIALKISALIQSAARSPFSGVGKPEPLRRNLKGWWSRRITQEHRLVYRIVGTGDAQLIEIAACRFHYE